MLACLPANAKGFYWGMNSGNPAFVWCLSVFPLLSQQKKPETPLEPTNPFLEDESGEDNVSEKDEDLDRVRLLIFICTQLFRNDRICTVCSLLHPSSNRNWYHIWCHSNMQFTFPSNVAWFDSHLNYGMCSENVQGTVCLRLYLPSIYQTLNMYFNITAWLWLSYCILISFLSSNWQWCSQYQVL